jgi:hypothetical protein
MATSVDRIVSEEDVQKAGHMSAYQNGKNVMLRPRPRVGKIRFMVLLPSKAIAADQQVRFLGD